MLRLSPVRRLALVLLVCPLVGCSADAPEAPQAESADASGDVRRELVEVLQNGEASVRADLDLGLGTITVGEAEAGALFQAEVTLPLAGLVPELETETVATESGPQARIRLGLGGEAANPKELGETRGLVWRLLFSHQTPLDLSLELGATDADLDLTGVPLRRLRVVCGVGEARLHADTPTSERGADIEVKAGVSAFTGDGLGNLRFRRFRFEGGVGRFALDFRGAAPEPGAEASLKVGIGELDVVLPRGVPLVVEAPSGRLSSVELPAGLVTLGRGRYATPGAERDPDAFTVRISSGPGKVRVRVE